MAIGQKAVRLKKQENRLRISRIERSSFMIQHVQCKKNPEPEHYFLNLNAAQKKNRCVNDQIKIKIYLVFYLKKKCLAGHRRDFTKWT